ncbi:MAG TPA: Sapep family Mn(2+)-dependent dipeptidase [Holophagaceae bacterium]|nr:Sapep family Mn(2+)-dependent dipeptidase [Holophagaceae bacterium]
MRFLHPALFGLLGMGMGMAQSPLATAYRLKEAPRMGPLVSEVLRFPTVAGNEKARLDQQAWVLKVGKDLGFSVCEAGKVTEVELSGPTGAPVIGLVVHGDVQPVDDQWTIPPFAGVVRNGIVLGRGAADDKGPLVQALLAMKVLKDSGRVRTHTIRLLVGSDEESTNLDFAEYLKDHKAPDFSLVLDSEFPVVVGEKAWNALTVETELKDRKHGDLIVGSMQSGLAASIVPDEAVLKLAENEHWASAQALSLAQRWKQHAFDPGISLSSKTGTGPDALTVTIHGKAAHAGVNAQGGRNALVALASLLVDELPEGGAKDLLAFAKLAGQDLKGTGLGLATADPVFGFPTVVPSLLKVQENGKVRLTINIRTTPTLSGEALKAHLFKQVADFNARTGAHLEPGGFFGDTPLAFDPQGKLVKRLIASYAKATGKAEAPAISGGGTYAKRIPNAIAFGMWFPGKPYPGHDVDEQVPLEDLHKGVEVLLEALSDLACGAPLREPLKP